MTYRDYFCIFEIAVFALGSVWLLLYYFCINPVFNWVRRAEQSSAGQIAVVLGMTYYMFAVASVVIEVIFGGMDGDDGATFYGFVTFFSVLIPCGALIITAFYWLYRGVKKLESIHVDMRSKRMGIDK